MKKTRILLTWLLLSMLYSNAGTITLDDCYAAANKNYPLIKQHELIDKTTEYSIQNAAKGYMPQFNIAGQATYQSDITSIPIHIPGMNIATLSKDQYKIYGEVNQVVYDGGIIGKQKDLQTAGGAIESQRLEVDLYALKDRINQLYFGILLIDEQLKQNELLKKDIELGITKMDASVKNGIALKSNIDVLKAELLKNNQRSIELKATRTAFTDMLSLFIGQTVNESTSLSRPQSVSPSTEIKRPELMLYEVQNKSLDIQDKMLMARNLPKINLFLQGGYGRPGLNMLDNTFKEYYIGGIKLNWSLSGFYTLKQDRAINEISRKKNDLQKELFLFNTNLNLKQQGADITKLQQLINTDEEIIQLRTSVKENALVLLENGVKDSNDYLREVNAEDNARQSRIVHEIQLLTAIYSQKTISGN